mmetsp:Transcript_39816/g.62583  ORF Transcript_39816/g.62583 Transcript_39816/m.62583 type:complete len:228 (+) Transcript_39816:220-903(+)
MSVLQLELAILFFKLNPQTSYPRCILCCCIARAEQFQLLMDLLQLCVSLLQMLFGQLKRSFFAIQLVLQAHHLLLCCFLPAPFRCHLLAASSAGILFSSAAQDFNGANGLLLESFIFLAPASSRRHQWTAAGRASGRNRWKGHIQRMYGAHRYGGGRPRSDGPRKAWLCLCLTRNRQGGSRLRRDRDLQRGLWLSVVTLEFLKLFSCFDFCQLSTSVCPHLSQNAIL